MRRTVYLFLIEKHSYFFGLESFQPKGTFCKYFHDLKGGLNFIYS